MYTQRRSMRILLPSHFPPRQHHRRTLPTSVCLLPPRRLIDKVLSFPNPAIGIRSGGDLVSTYAQQTQQNGVPLQQQHQ